jgi:hypothetical protein
MAGFMLNAVVPVFVTVTTDCVKVLLSRLLPKLNELPLKDAFVEADGGAALTVIAAVMLWLSEPEVPWSEMLALPTAAAGPAVTLICCSPPGAMDRVIGVAVTALGKELTVTLTFPVNPFTGEAVTAMVCGAPPGVIATVEGAMARVKSAGAFELPPPLHPAKTVSKEIAHRKGIRDSMREAPMCIRQVVLLLSMQRVQGRVRCDSSKHCSTDLLSGRVKSAAYYSLQQIEEKRNPLGGRFPL